MRAEIIQLRSKRVNACVWVTFIHLGHKTRCVPFPWIIIEYGHEYGHSQASEWDSHLTNPDIFLSTVKEKWSHFDLKIESLTELKFDPGLEIFDQGRKFFFFRLENSTLDWSNWRLFESNWLDIETQLLGIPGWISVPLVTQLFRSTWLHYYFIFKCLDQSPLYVSAN